MSETKKDTPSGTIFSGLLTIVFIVLKLLGKITWSWWWVLSPIWISWSILFVVFLLFFVALFVIKLFERTPK